MADVSSEDEFDHQLSLAEEEGASLPQGMTYTDEDGTVMEWYYERKAYFPKIDTYQIAQYQISYGVDARQEEGYRLTEEDRQARFNDYWKNYYSVCSQDQPPVPEVHTDHHSEDKSNLMEQPKKNLKRQSCKESVTLAVQMLDGVDVRGHTLHVDTATFQLKRTFDPKRKQKKLKNKMKHKYRDTHQIFAEYSKQCIARDQHIVIFRMLSQPEEFHLSNRELGFLVTVLYQCYY